MIKISNETIIKKSKNTGKVVAEMTKNAVIHRHSSSFNPVKAGIKLPTAGIKKGQKQSKAKIHPFLLGKPENSGLKKGQLTKKILERKSFE
jgi:hypothetical protein